VTGAPRLLAGTSGYSYKQWKGPFYPGKLPAAKMLSWYASRLPAVEINATFYRLPRRSVVETWAAEVPEEFRFAVKASRRITHLKRLEHVGEEMAYLLETLGALGPKLGAVLVQLPPTMKRDLGRLRAFLALPRGGVRFAFEFRHPSWTDEDVHAVLREYDCALCLSDVDDAPEPALVPTAAFGYLRLRRTDYAPDALAAWHARVVAQPWCEAFVFFKHEDEGVAPGLATALLGLGGGEAG
jgi:uncharacterized protein YecE (DUF72 family)